MRNLIIFGDSQFAERISKYIIAEKQDHLIGFTQEKQFISRNEINGFLVYPFDELSSLVKGDFEIILGIGYSKMNSLRRKIYELSKVAGYKVGTYISSNAINYSEKIGEGCFICPGVIVGPDCKVGAGNFIASCTVLSHDNTIGDFNFISTNVVFGGFAVVRDNCFFGLHSTIRDDVTISSGNLIGSGANVLKSIESEYGVYVGSPARMLSFQNSESTRI